MPALPDLAALYLRLGCTAFGGPAAHMAMLEDEVVRRRGWLTQEEFLDLLGAANLIPGPSSTELAIFIGQRIFGWRGLLLGGFCFIAPAAMITLAFAWGYVRFNRLPQLQAVLYGIKPVLIAVILQALLRLSKTAFSSLLLAGVGLIAFIASLAGISPILVLFGSGVLFAAILVIQLVMRGDKRSIPGSDSSGFLAWIPGAFQTSTVSSLADTSGWSGPGALSVFLFFLKVGAIVFGSGYVLLAFLQDDLVHRLHWLTSQQLLDAVAVGQFTPGPVFSTATFIGYLLGGLPGAAAATVGIFLPSFLLVAIAGPFIPRLRKNASFTSFLRGVTAASVALMGAVCWQLGKSAFPDWFTIALGTFAIFWLFRKGTNSSWLVLSGAALGLVYRALMH